MFIKLYYIGFCKDRNKNYIFTSKYCKIIFVMDLVKIHYQANCLIAQTYNSTVLPENGSVTLIVDGVSYIVYFCKVESGWNIVRTKKL